MAQKYYTHRGRDTGVDAYARTIIHPPGRQADLRLRVLVVQGPPAVPKARVLANVRGAHHAVRQPWHLHVEGIVIEVIVIEGIVIEGIVKRFLAHVLGDKVQVDLQELVGAEGVPGRAEAGGEQAGLARAVAGHDVPAVAAVDGHRRGGRRRGELDQPEVEVHGVGEVVVARVHRDPDHRQRLHRLAAVLRGVVAAVPEGRRVGPDPRRGFQAAPEEPVRGRQGVLAGDEGRPAEREIVEGGVEQADEPGVGVERGGLAPDDAAADAVPAVLRGLLRGLLLLDVLLDLLAGEVSRPRRVGGEEEVGNEERSLHAAIWTRSSAVSCRISMLFLRQSFVRDPSSRKDAKSLVFSSTST